MRPHQLLIGALALPLIAASPRAVAPDDHSEVVQTIEAFKAKDPSLSKFFNSATGYAVFPSIAKGAIGIGGAHGTGELLVAGKAVGETSMTQVTIGLALGGQEYSEIVFFQNHTTLDSFKSGEFAFAAQVSAVAVKAGASADSKYRDGVAVFTLAKGGLMYEASVGGQKFSYKPFGSK